MKNTAEYSSVNGINGNANRSSKTRAAIIILALLLALSVCGLAARYIYLAFFAEGRDTVTVPDNLIGRTESASVGTGNLLPAAGIRFLPYANTSSSAASGAGEQASVLELYNSHPGDNEAFEVSGMLPGDTVTKYFCIKAYHDTDITVYFTADITEQTARLGDALKIKVTRLDDGTVLCDDSFSAVDGKEFSEKFAAGETGETVAYYRVDVSADTSLGNEYQEASLTADFSWFVKDDGGLLPPTGDGMTIGLWITAAISLSMLIVLLLKRRKEEKSSEQ